ncbi:MAG TPA: sugar porter family MFS transporter [Victivallales bacterium]|nr:sugar porter family MFS transporter [Victivallales bacterium]
MQELTVKRKFGFSIYMIAVIAALGGLLFGLDQGIISGALPFIKNSFHIGTTMQEVVVSSLMVGCVCGVISIRPISQKFGRKKALLISGALFVLASVSSGLSANVEILILSRFFIGISVGIASFVTPIYIAEIAPRQIRGGMIALFQFLIVLGIALAFLVDSALTPFGAWRFMLGSISIPGIIMLIGLFFLPESPRWLMLYGRQKETEKILKRLDRTDEEVKFEINEISQSASEKQSSWKFLRNKNYRKVLYLGIGLQLFQQLCGWVALVYYAPSIFSEMGFKTPESRIWVAFIVCGAFHVLATMLPVFLNDKWGRKKLLYIGVSLNIFSMIMIASLFFFGIDAANWIKYLAVTLLLLFNIGYSISLGPVVWTLCSEIFPLRGRDLGMMTATAANWIGSFFVAQLTLTFMGILGPGWTFIMFAVIGVLTIIFTYMFVPETKGIPLEEIEKALLSGKKLKNIGI